MASFLSTSSSWCSRSTVSAFLPAVVKRSTGSNTRSSLATLNQLFDNSKQNGIAGKQSHGISSLQSITSSVRTSSRLFSTAIKEPPSASNTAEEEDADADEELPTNESDIDLLKLPFKNMKSSNNSFVRFVTRVYVL